VSQNRLSENGVLPLPYVGGLQNEDNDCSTIHCNEDSDVSEDENEDNSSIFKQMSFIDSVKYWALPTNQTHHSIRMMLEILRAHTSHTFPKDPRTLLKTPRTATNIKNIEGGQYWYNGLQQCIINNFSSADFQRGRYNGLPLHKSSSAQFWPILANIHELPDFPVMTVAIFCGSTKPKNLNEFLEPLVTELNYLMTNGVFVKSRNIGVILRAIIADSPARAFIKGVAYFNAKNGCLKCKCVGEFNHDSNTVVFRGINAPLRTDHEFRKVLEVLHHKAWTPLLLLKNFNIIEDVTIADPLHLIYLGMMRRLLFGWRDGILGKYTKWDGKTVEQISNWLKNVNLPYEFHRKTRDLYCLRHWKGTEFNFLPEDAYEHFMFLFCSITLLSSNIYKTNWKLAAEMLELYILDFEKKYGLKYITSNVHNLQHIYNDVEKFGPMLSISTFTFENELQSIKHMLRS
uniref:Transposase domain-containing protein n=1 Tax=Anopheles epiroticus TaxID=199890 RepID=A0A182PX40_9DIPT